MDPYAYIREAVSALRMKDQAFKLFGANGHEYEFQSPCPENELVEFEQKHGITLPREYRGFLTEVGNGGAGPFYGVFKLGEMDDGHGEGPWEQGVFVGTLRDPWPHRAEWNLPDEDLAFPEDLSDEEAEVAVEARDKKYWNESLVAGAFPLCHQGCALRDWLVVTGPEAGQVWYDGRAHNEGLRPYERADGRRRTFLDWYIDWLDDALRKFKISVPPSVK
jgi:hypothetical protein